jgi:hypothetical protein
LLEIEACINSRPLTFVGDTLESQTPLTPANFLVQKTSLLDRSPLPHPKTSLQESQLMQNLLLHQFWTMWSTEYIRNLPLYNVTKTLPIVPGALVLVREDNCPHMQWLVGHILEVYKSVDGAIHSCKLKTPRGEIVRAVQRLHILEMDEQSTEELETAPEVDRFDCDTDVTEPKVPHKWGRDNLGSCPAKCRPNSRTKG